MTKKQQPHSLLLPILMSLFLY